MKILGIILLVATLLVSGALYISNNKTLQMQQATSAQADDKSLRTADDTFEVTEEEPLPAPSGESDEVSTQSIGDIQATSRQIIAVQQQIEGRMISCVQDAQRAQRTVASLRQQENALRTQRDALAQRISQIETSTPAGRERRDALRREQDNLDDRRAQVRDRINEVRRTFNDNRNACRREVSRLRTVQNKLEAANSRQFNVDTNIRFAN